MKSIFKKITIPLVKFVAWPQRKSEKALELININEKFIIESATEGMCVVDNRGNLILVNSSAAKLIGWEVEQLLGKPHHDVFHHSRIDQTPYPYEESLIFKALKDGTIQHCGNEFFWRKDKTNFPVYYSITPLIEREKISGALIVFRDITEHMKDTKRILEQQNLLIQSSKMSALGEMAGGIAHEINNPLAIINSYADMLRDSLIEEKIDVPEALRRVEKILMTTKRIAKIIKSMKLFARDSENDPFEKTTLKQIVEVTLDLCREKFKVRGIELIVDEISIEICLECRAFQISQIVLNLLNNACDAIENAPQKWIKVSAKENAGQVEIVVEDSGPEIPLAVRNKILEPFFTTKEIDKGTGLGLSISKGLAEIHHGKLYLDQDPSHTRFVISLPVCQPPNHRQAA